MVQTTVNLLTAGYCMQMARIADRKKGFGKAMYPAGFAAFEHPTEGVVLYDTGYSEHFEQETKKFPFNIYAKLTPNEVKAEETAKSQLEAQGIGVEDVKHIIISHYHGDHIAGLKDFPKATFWTTIRGHNYHQNKKGFGALRRGFVPGLLPEDFSDRVRYVEQGDLVSLEGRLDPFTHGKDIFGDGSIITVPLPGHAVGQIGALVNDYFFVADAVWDSKNYTENTQPSRLGNLIHHNSKQYKQTMNNIRELYQEHPEISIVPSHCLEYYDLTMRD